MLNRKSPPVIIFNNINVLAIETVSGIFIGSNTQLNWSSASKSNTGFGTVLGKNNEVKYPYNVVIDPDYVDTVFK